MKKNLIRIFLISFVLTISLPSCLLLYIPQSTTTTTETKDDTKNSKGKTSGTEDQIDKGLNGPKCAPLTVPIEERNKQKEMQRTD